MMTLTEALSIALHGWPTDAAHEVAIDGDRRELQLWFFWEDGSRSLTDSYRYA